MQQEMLALKERNNMLERQLLKTMTERDTIQASYDKLVAKVNTTDTVSPAPAVYMREKCPAVCFWTAEEFARWTGTAEASINPRWKLAYLENDDGKMISEGTIKALRKTIKSAWKELAMNNKAPGKWGKASASARDYVYNIVYKEYPFMKLALNNWKVDELCSLDYPGWVRNNSDGKGNWLSAQPIKTEEEIESSGAGESSASTIHRGKRKAQDSKSKHAPKKIKGESDADTGVTDNSPIDSPTPASSETDSTSLPPDHTTSSSSPEPSSTSAAVATSQDLSSKLINPTEPKAATTDEEDKRNEESGAINEVGGAINEVGGAINEPSGAIHEPSSTINEPSGTINEVGGTIHEASNMVNEAIESIESPHVAINPLGILAKAALTIKVPPLPPMPALQSSAKDAITATKNKPNSAVGSRKMRVVTRCWLRQVNEAGTNEEFRHYWYKILNDTQRDAYKKEVADLITTNTWNDDTFNGPLH